MANISWFIVTRFCTVFAVLTVVVLSVTADMSAGACAILVLGSDCVVNILYAVELWADEWADAITDGTTETDVDVSVRILARALTWLRVALPAPSEDTLLSRFALFSRWPMTALLEITSPSPSEEPSLV